MKSSWLWFILSLFCLVVGLTLVLIFTGIFIVPELISGSLVTTQCHIESVSGGSKVTNAPPSNETTEALNSSCPVVIANYQLPDGQRRKGLLYDTTKVRTVKMHQDSQCFCQNCWLSAGSAITEPESGRQLIIREGDVIKCRYASPFSLPEARRLHGVLLLNVMFWPTVVFICGFVGIFFTCITLAKENWRCSDAETSTDREVCEYMYSTPCKTSQL